MRRVKVIGRSSELRNGAAAKFEFEREGVRLEGFVLRYEDKIAAYENRCRHLPLSLDLDGQFFTPDGRYLICQMHGAMYEPATGECVMGPCHGAALKPLPIELSGGLIWLME